MTEESTIELLNTLGTKLIKCNNRFSSYDAEDKNYIVEIKNRRGFYPEKLIECLKLFKNYQKSQLSGKDFLYVVTDESGCYIFNITRDIKSILPLGIIALECPATTDFDKTKKIIKYSFVLPSEMAKRI